MASSPLFLLWCLLVLTSTGWLLFSFAAKGLAWLLGKALKANVSFQFDGLLCVKDLSIQFTRGSIASVSVADINLQLLYPFAWLGIHYGQSEPKLQLSILEIDIFVQKPKKSARRDGSGAKKARDPNKIASPFKYWPILAKVGRYCSIAASDFVVRIVEIPNASLEIDSVDLDAFDLENSPEDTMGLRLVIASIQAHVRDMRFDNEVLDLIYSQQPTMGVNRDSCLFSLEHFTVTSNLDFGKDTGLVIQHVEVSLGDAAVDLTEELLFGENGLMAKLSSKKQSDGVGPQIVSQEPKVEGQPQEEQPVNSSVVAPEDIPGASRTSKGHGMVPEKILFKLPIFSLNFSQRDDGPVMRNKITGISLQTRMSKSAGEAEDQVVAIWDTLFECGEICILEETEWSLFRVARVSVVAIVEMQSVANFRPRVKIDASVEGTRCNLHLQSVDKILKFCFRLPKKDPNSDRTGTEPSPPRPKKKRKSELSWVCTVSIPDIVIAALDSNGATLHKISSQSLQLLVDNVSGPATRMQLELWELEVSSVEEVGDRPSFAGGITPSQFFRLGTLVVEWGKDELRVEEENDVRTCSVLIVELSDMVLMLSATRIQSLLAVAMSAKAYMKSVLGGKTKTKPKSTSSSSSKKKRGWMRTELGVRGFSVQFMGPAVVDEGDVPDPKTVNYGDQGGRVVISQTEDGSLRTANVRATEVYVSRKGDLFGRATFEIASGLVTYDNEKKDVRVLVDSAELHHKDLDSEGFVILKTSLLVVQNMSVLYEGSNSAAGLPARLLLSMKALDGHWNPDVHLFYHDIALQLLKVGKGWSEKSKEANIAEKGVSKAEKDESPSSSAKPPKNKQKLRIAVDLEKLNLTAKAAEEADFRLHVHLLVSEDMEIGFLVDRIAVDANNAQFVRLEHGQFCRLPWVSPEECAEMASNGQTKRDWKLVVQARAVHTFMPFRLGFMALDYAAEDMERVLRLVMKMQKSKWSPSSPSVHVSQPIKKHASSSQIQVVSVSVEELHFEIEEEPIQGWLDEHYHLMRKEVCELLVREKLLEEKHNEVTKHNVDAQFQSSSELGAGVQKKDEEWNRLQEEAFSSYRKACESLVPEEFSEAWKGPLQSGFRVSKKRRSLLSAKATHVEMSLTLIKGSIIEAARRLDCVGELQIPYAKCFGRHLDLQASSLVVNLRDYTLPLLSTGFLDCEGDVVIAQQATAFPPQYRMEVPLGQLRVVEVWRSISGATPAYKTFLDLVIQADRGEFSYGVGYEPLFADLSYAFSVALAKAKSAVPVVKKERSLPWWDDMRYYIHGKNTLKIKNFKWTLQATTDPYEDQEVLDLVATNLEVEQSEGSVVLNTGEFKWFMMQGTSGFQSPCSSESADTRKFCFLHSPGFKTEVLMVWDCESGNPFQHYLHPFPADPNPPTKRFDLYRSTSLSLTFAFSLLTSPVSNAIVRSGQSLQRMMGMKSKSSVTRPGQILGGFRPSQQADGSVLGKQGSYPTMHFGSDELAWIFKLWNLLYLPPQKIRTFSRWPRYGVPRIPRSGNLSLDKVMTEYLLRVEATPGCIKHISPQSGDPAQGLTFTMKKLRYELLYSRCQTFFDSFSTREPLLAVYQGLDITVLNAMLDRSSVSAHKNGDRGGEYDREDKVKELLGLQEDFLGESGNDSKGTNGSMNDRGYLLSIDSLTLRKQAPKADVSQLSALLHYRRLSRSDKALVYIPEIAGNGSDPARSDASDDDGLVAADNCLRVSVYGLKLLWTLPNRDAVWAWSEDLARAFETPKPSPSRQAAQRKIREWHERQSSEASPKPAVAVVGQSADTTEEEGVMHFMVNVVQPQFNLDSEDAHGRLLFAAASGKVLAQSFHSIVAVAPDAIANVLAKSGVVISPQGGTPVIAWKRRELSVMLEQVQAHVAPTDVDLGAGLQWLPKVPTGDLNRSPKVRRTGTLLERVFTPCDMYFQYTRHKGGTTDVKVKPLKELSFNSSGITATMTSNQFHIMMDVISNLLLARLPKPRKRPSVHQVSGEVATEEDGEEEVDEVVPEGVEEVEVARIKLEQAERECQAMVSHCGALRRLGYFPESTEIQALERDFGTKCRERKAAALLLRAALKRAAQHRLAEKEKNRSPLAAMRISWTIDKFGWNMLCDGESFAEAEIDSMILKVDRDFDDIGVARFTTKSFVVKNCLPGAKSSTILSPWNPPAGEEWGRNVMLRVDARQGAPKDGHSPLELFQVEIYPLKIHLTESMYKMMWEYLFPEEEHEVQRQSVRTQHQKLSLTLTTASGGSRDGRLASRDEEVESLMDDGNSRTSVRTSASSLQFCIPDDSHNPSVNLTTTAITTVETVKIREQKTRKGSKGVVQDEKKVTEEKKVTRTHKSVLEFYNIKISQVELLVTYEGSRFSVGDMRLLMDTFARDRFSGSWRRLFSKVKKHIIWSVLKSVTGMQGKKFKDKLPAASQIDGLEVGDNSSDSDSSTSQTGHDDQFPIVRFKKYSDRAGEGFVSSIRGLFNSQRRKAKNLVLKRLTTDLRTSTESVGYMSGNDLDTITSSQDYENLDNKTKRLLHRHSRKLRSSAHAVFGMPSPSSSSSSPQHADGDHSDASSTYEDFHD